jgi:hypothetical protein
MRNFYAFLNAVWTVIVARMGQLRSGVSLLALTVVLGAAGCNSGPAMPSAAPLVFPGAPAATVASASGGLRIDVWWSPAQPIVGYNATQLAISDAGGSPVSGLVLSIVPWMTAHGHSASVLPTVMEISPGTYVATPVDFFMAGQWELRTAITSPADGGGADAAIIDDTAGPTVNVP